MYTQQWYMSYRCEDSFRAGPGPARKLSTNLMYRGTALNMQSSMPIQICEISASSWFYYYYEICYDARSQERKIPQQQLPYFTKRF